MIHIKTISDLSPLGSQRKEETMEKRQAVSKPSPSAKRFCWPSMEYYILVRLYLSNSANRKSGNKPCFTQLIQPMERQFTKYSTQGNLKGALILPISYFHIIKQVVPS